MEEPKIETPKVELPTSQCCDSFPDSNLLCSKCNLPFILKGSEPKPVGRPSTYTKELADLICSRIIEGKSLRSILNEEDMPDKSTVFRWLREFKEFRDNYDSSVIERTLAMGEEIIDIADEGTNDFMTITKGDVSYNVEDREVTNRSKLRVETRKWLMSKMQPKKYGDKVDVTSDGKAIQGNTILLNDFKNATDSK